MQEHATDRRETGFEYIDCNLCGARSFAPLFESHDYLLFSPLTFKLVRCNTCGLVFLNPRPEKMDQYYTGYYNAIFTKGCFEWLSPDRTRIIKRMRTQGKVLDIGCGKGDFLYRMSKNGWDVYGNDLSADNCDYGRTALGLKNIYCGLFESADLPENFFDIITLFNVLEHLKNPRQTLQKIHRLLKDDGVLIIESPDFGSLQSRIFKNRWYGLDLPRHLYQLSPASAAALLKQAQFTIYKRDYFVHSLYLFLSLQVGILRSAGMHTAPANAPPKTSANTGPAAVTILKHGMRMVLSILCLFISFLLGLINCKDIFRVYCKKAAVAAADSRNNPGGLTF